MKKIWVGILTISAFVSFSQAEMKCAPGKCGSAMISDKTVSNNHKTKQCAVCGMKLQIFPQTKYTAQVNEKTKYYCSIHCLAADIQKGLKPKHIEAMDAETLKYIDANKAYYVINKNKRGTMSMTSKLAFSSKKSAEKFAKKYGGKISNFSEALLEASNDFKTK